MSKRGKRGPQAKTQALVQAAWEVLAEHHPMTLRQVFYQLVSRQVVKNTEKRYKSLSGHLVNARKDGVIPWGWIEDRLRRPRQVSMWQSLADFARDAAAAYRCDVWGQQEQLLEVWLEKDALSGIFEDVLEPYGVTLNVGRGFDSWDSVHNAALRYREYGGPVAVLYFGDFDPSGEDMMRSLAERLGFFGTCPEITKSALTRMDIDSYGLPFNPTKLTDSRRAAFVAKWGDVAVELDALPVGVLQDRLRAEVEQRLDLDALETVRAQEEQERARIVEALGAVP